MSDDYKLYFYLSEILKDPDMLKPPESVVHGLAWEGRSTMLAAREKGGKSTLVGAAAAAVSAGSPFLGQPTEEGMVLWISLEEHMSEIARRFMQFGANPENIVVANAFPDAAKDIPGVIYEPDLVVWDTLGALADVFFDRPIEPNDSARWTRVVRWMTSLTRELETSSVILHHARKSDGRYRDSTAIGANVDVILEMFGEGTNPRKIKGVGRWMIEEMTVILREDGFQMYEHEDRTEKAMLEFIKANPNCSWRQIRDAISGRATDLARARDSLLERGIISEDEGAGRKASQFVVPT